MTLPNGHIIVLLGEQTDWTTDYLGKQNTCRASGHSGQWAGSGWRGQERPLYYVGHTHNITTVTLPLGTRICPTPGTQDYAGENGTSNPNTPIRSAHPGGALILFGDGSVHFLSESLETDLFKKLAVRDSGEIKEWQ